MNWGEGEVGPITRAMIREQVREQALRDPEFRARMDYAAPEWRELVGYPVSEGIGGGGSKVEPDGVT